MSYLVRIPGKRRWYAPWLRHPSHLEERLTQAEREAFFLSACEWWRSKAIEDMTTPNRALLDRLGQ